MTQASMFCTFGDFARVFLWGAASGSLAILILVCLIWRTSVKKTFPPTNQP